MQLLQNIITIKRSVEAEYLQNPSIQAIDVGYKYVQNELTETIAIRFFVKKGTPNIKQLIPDFIQGIPTDVIETDPIKLMVGVFDPMQGGAEITVGSHSGRGTAGMVVFDRDNGYPLILSNHHVMADPTTHNIVPGELVYQPVIGKFGEDSRTGGVLRSVYDGIVDGAVSELQFRESSSFVKDIGSIVGVGKATLGMHVRKSGAVTGLTSGTVTGVDASGRTEDDNRLFTHQITVVSDQGPQSIFLASGDSGSVLVNDANQVVALMFAGGGITAYGNPIDQVLDRLFIEIYNPDTDPVALFRYYDPGIDKHFYTASWKGINRGIGTMHFEGPQCALYRNSRPGTVPLYRYHSTSSYDHFYTTNFAELGSGGGEWAAEGITGYVYPSPQPGTVPLYRYVSSDGTHHFYTTDATEIKPGTPGWKPEGIQCYVFPWPLPRH